MAIIPQSRLFPWEDVENRGELKRLELLLRTVPDEQLMHALEADRGRGRDDYPVRAVWNSVLAGIGAGGDAGDGAGQGKGAQGQPGTQSPQGAEPGGSGLAAHWLTCRGGDGQGGCVGGQGFGAW